MPFRRTFWAVLALFPLVLVAFWPGYFGKVRAVPFSLHAHGLAATAWLILVAVQLWSIHARRVRLHRAAGLAVFVVVPLFAAGSLLALRDMALLAAAKADGFHTLFGTRLGIVDLAAVIAFVALVAVGLRARRRVGLHAGAMVATVLLALPPILARLYTAPFIALIGLPFPLAFAASFHLANLTAAALALWLARGDAAAPLRATAAVVLATGLLFELAGPTRIWADLLGAGARVPPAVLALVGLGGAGAALWFGWAGGRRGAPGRMMPATAG